MPATLRSSDDRSGFEADISGAMARVREALATVLDVLPGTVARPHEVSKALGIDKKLGWQIARIVQEHDPFAAARHVPGAGAARTFLRAARKRGVPTGVLDDVAERLAELEQMVQRHAGDRGSFEMMLPAYAAQDRTTLDVAHKKLAFQGNSYLLGVQARTHLVALFLNVSDDPGLIDAVGVHGLVRLRRLRHTVPVIISRTRHSDDDGRARSGPVSESLDPQTQSEHGAALIPQFCSDPVPRVREHLSADGYVHNELLLEHVGDTAAKTYFGGLISRRAFPRYRDQHNHLGGSHASVRTPAEALVMDLIIREDAFGPIQPEVRTYADHAADPAVPGPGRERDRLDVVENIEELGRDVGALRCPDVPRYVELGRFVFDRMGWDASGFRVFRARIEYPVLPSSVVIQFNLPER
jgi:hypothetical protein